MVEVRGGKIICPEAKTAGPNTADVVKIEYEKGIVVNRFVNANGGNITLTVLNDPDYRNFEVTDILYYEPATGNSNINVSNRKFRVIGTLGSCKYKLAEA